MRYLKAQIRYLHYTLGCIQYPLAIIGLDLFGTPLMFFAGMSIAFVGAAANFRQNELTNKVHMIGAGTGVVAAI